MTEEKEISPDGIDWAYARLVKTAKNGDSNQVRALAVIFKPEVLSACFGMACADIDHAYEKGKNARKYRIVRDVCGEIDSLAMAIKDEPHDPEPPFDTWEEKRGER